MAPGPIEGEGAADSIAARLCNNHQEPTKGPAKSAGQEAAASGGQPQPCPDRPSRPHSCLLSPGSGDEDRRKVTVSWGSTGHTGRKTKEELQEWMGLRSRGISLRRRPVQRI